MRRLVCVAMFAAAGCSGSSALQDPVEPPSAAATPTFWPPEDVYSTAQSVTISSATPGAVIHCTQDGSTPGAASPTCATAISVPATTTLKAIATAAGHLASPVATATYTIDAVAPRAATPTFWPPEGAYTSTQSVTISSTTAGAVIHCTQDGSTPSAASPTCATAISVSASKTLKAIATAAGHLASAVATAAYTITLPPRAATPTFWPPEGVYSTTQSVTISSTTAGAVIHCTQDGSTPSAASPTCATAISVSASKTLKAIARATGYSDSLVGSAAYTIGSVTLVEKLTALSTKRQWFMHQSVGNQMMNGLSGDYPWGTRGVFGTLLGGCTAYDCPITSTGYKAGVRGMGAPTGIAQIPVGTWAESYTDQFQGTATNGWPDRKLTAFDNAVRNKFSACDYVGLKFCFTDIADWSAGGTGAGTINGLFALYQTTMDALEASFPGKIVYWTMPLVPANADAYGAARETFNGLVRARYASTGRLADIADWESRDANGNLVLSGGIRVLNAAWNGDGQGHVNAAGSDMLALKYLDLMYRVVTAP